MTILKKGIQINHERTCMVCSDNSLLNPRSPTLTVPSKVRKILAGFRSRCMIRFSCMCCHVRIKENHGRL